MAEQIRTAQERHAGQISSSSVAAHCLPLSARLRGIDLGEMLTPANYEPMPTADGEERGIALTPYSFERLDSLAGYESGMPNPGFYQQIWEDRQSRSDQRGELALARKQTHRAVLGRIVETLRNCKQLISSADLIAAESTASGAGVAARAWLRLAYRPRRCPDHIAHQGRPQPRWASSASRSGP